MTKQLDPWGDATEALRRRVTNLETELETVYASASWRITAPLRVVYRGLRSLLRNVRRAFKLIGWLGTGQFGRAGQALLPYYERYVPLRVKDMMPYAVREAVRRALSLEITSQLGEACGPVGRLGSPLRGAAHWASSVRSPRASLIVKRGLFNKRLTIAVIAWDVCHNSVERAYLIAEALSRYFNVVLLGPAFQQYGGRIWEPLENANLRIIPLPASDLPELVEVFEQVSERLAADAIIACKPRLPSLLLGHLLKSKLNRPLFVDIDDYELAFTKDGTPLGLKDVADALEKERRVPHSDTWTRFCDNYLDGTDGFFVSNEALQRRYGGILVPHARDERLFDPDLYDRSALRGALGLAEEDKVVLFAGTPRADNGVLATLEVVLAISDPRVKILVVGRPTESSLEKKMRRLGQDRLILLGNRPVDELPCYVACSDAVCLLQDPIKAISQWHLPATIAEALAFGLPVLATPVAPLKPLIKAGVVAETSEKTLPEDLKRHLFHEVGNAEKSRQRREYFLAHMSYATIGAAMATAIHKSLERKQPITPNSTTAKIVELASSLPSRVEQPSRQETSKRGLDIVMVWKQYDLCLYGRRIDMLIKYLAARKEVRRVVALDRPVGYEYFCQWQHTHAAHQDRSMYVEWLRKSWGLHDSEKVRYHNFTYSTRDRPDRLAVWRWPRLDEYLDFLAESFARNDVNPAQAIFIVYPRNQHISEIVERFRPGRLVADVVDDQRAWPNVDEGTRHTLTEHYREVLGMSDFVITNCEPVKQAMSEFHQDIRVLPNGIDMYLDEYYPMSSRFREFNTLPHPRIGFVGNLEQKIDIDLLRYLAMKRPQWQLILVGSVHANPKVLELADLPNVYFPGVVPYEEAKHWIRNFDVAILPHLRTELTRHMNPLKFYVYLGLGVPVVSTPIGNLGDLSQYITIAPDAGAFIDGIENELNRHESEINPDLNRDISNNTWEQRVNTLLSWLLVRGNELPER